MLSEGRTAKRLTVDEQKVIFDGVSRGEVRGKVREHLQSKGRTTVNRAYNVVAEFERQGLIRLDDAAARDIAERAGYEATPCYAQDLFLRWLAWKGGDFKATPDEIPKLRLGSASVKLWTDGQSGARFATVEQVSSKVEAPECWARVVVLSPPGLSLPLHWAGTPYTPEEASAPRITIYPWNPARLDVAFTLPPTDPKPKAFEGSATSGQITSTMFKVAPDLTSRTYFRSGAWDSVAGPSRDGRGC